MATQAGAANKQVDVRRMVTMAMLCAIGIVLVAFFEIPIIPAAPFLKYDPADIPILIGALIYGPVAGVIMTVVVSFIQSFMLHGSGGVIGFVMHVLATGAMVLVAGGLYHMLCRRGGKTLSSAAVSLAAGTLAMTIAMIGMNLIFTPIFMNVPVDVVKGMLVPAIIPFNLLKAGINSAVCFTLFRVVEKIVRR